jgi:hypothetical protein
MGKDRSDDFQIENIISEQGVIDFLGQRNLRVVQQRGNSSHTERGDPLGYFLDNHSLDTIHGEPESLLGPQEFWENVKDEFRLLVCTNDKKYRELRRLVKEKGGQTQVAIITAIASAIGAAVGVLASAIVPFVALLLIAMLKIGKEAFCRA